MTTTRKDPLLMSAKVMTVIARVVLVFGMVALGIGAAGVAAASFGWLPAEVLEGLQVEAGFNIADLWMALFPITAALIVLALSYDFVSRLAAMIDTVGQGEAFSLANAARLTRMGWLALGIEAASFVAGMLGDWAERHFDGESFEFTSDFSVTGIALALVLFILARVFREGARMRDELEGTV